MKSWKNERLRRKKLFASIKLRRHLAQGLSDWSDLLLKSYKNSFNALRTINESKSD